MIWLRSAVSRRPQRSLLGEDTRAAERGDAESQFDLGFMYATGFGDFEADRAEALTWYRRAAEQGLAQAQSALGGAYARGDILEQDFTQAATWCRLGAEQDDADGQLCMARCMPAAAASSRTMRNPHGGISWPPTRGAGRLRPDSATCTPTVRVASNGIPLKRTSGTVEPGTYHSTKMAGVEIFSGRHLLFHLFVLARLYQDGIGIPQNDVAAYKWLDTRNRLLSAVRRRRRENGSPEAVTQRASPPRVRAQIPATAEICLLLVYLCRYSTASRTVYCCWRHHQLSE